MNTIICLDEKNGMLFNKRRQSRDRILNERIIELAKGAKLWMNSYSAKLFDGYEINICDEPQIGVGDGDFCFFEQAVTQDILDKSENVYVFLWNRHYPADVYFTFDLEKEGFALSETEEFAGSSHEKLTLNIYRRK